MLLLNFVLSEYLGFIDTTQVLRSSSDSVHSVGITAVAVSLDKFIAECTVRCGYI